MLGKPRIYLFSSTRLINSKKHEHSCKILYLIFYYLLFQQPDNVIFVMDASIGQACESQVSYLNFLKTRKIYHRNWQAKFFF